MCSLELQMGNEFFVTLEMVVGVLGAFLSSCRGWHVQFVDIFLRSCSYVRIFSQNIKNLEELYQIA